MIDGARLTAIAAEQGTPVWIYDAGVIRRQIARVRAFDVVRYAQKAASNVHLLRLMREEGVLVDAVSGGRSPGRWRPATGSESPKNRSC